jgi:hypothetical protein
MSVCELCEKRSPKRYCLGVRNEICSICCGEEREITVDCPLDCEYLHEARRREKSRQIDPADVPNQDIEVTDRFLREVEPLLVRTSHALLESAFETSAVDTDLREAFESMIKTLKTRDSGIIYESRPGNPYAGAIQQRTMAAIEEFRQQVTEQMGITTVRDRDVLGVLVFLQRVEIHQNNGRTRSRAFIDFLRMNFGLPPQPGQEPAGPIITPP